MTPATPPPDAQTIDTPIPATGSAAAPAALSWLAHVPAPLFAAVMGLAGLGLAWRRAHEALGWPQAVGEALLALSAAVFAALVLLYAAKLVRFPAEVRAEFAHPVRVNFFPAMSISLLLMAIAALPYGRGLAEPLWLAGAVLHLGFAVAVIRRWIVHPYQIQQINPAWFIPVVGNIIVPIAGVPLGYAEVAWLFFAVGLVFWLVLFAIVLYRIIFHDPLPGRLIPTLVIMLAPPAIGLSAWLALNGGVLDALGRTLFGVALFLTLVLATLTRLFARVPFAVSWWAFTFPSAAMAIAALRYHELVPGTPTLILAAILLLAASAIIALVTVRTVGALLGGTLFVPE